MDDSMAWYIVNTFSGYENKARLALEERIRSLGKEDDFGQILVPEEQVVERTKIDRAHHSGAPLWRMPPPSRRVLRNGA